MPHKTSFFLIHQSNSRRAKNWKKKSFFFFPSCTTLYIKIIFANLTFVQNAIMTQLERVRWHCCLVNCQGNARCRNFRMMNWSFSHYCRLYWFLTTTKMNLTNWDDANATLSNYYRNEFNKRFGVSLSFLATHSGLLRWQDHSGSKEEIKPEWGISNFPTSSFTNPAFICLFPELNLAKRIVAPSTRFGTVAPSNNIWQIQTVLCFQFLSMPQRETTHSWQHLTLCFTKRAAKRRRLPLLAFNFNTQRCMHCLETSPSRAVMLRVHHASPTTMSASLSMTMAMSSCRRATAILESSLVTFVAIWCIFSSSRMSLSRSRSTTIKRYALLRKIRRILLLDF